MLASNKKIQDLSNIKQTCHEPPCPSIKASRFQTMRKICSKVQNRQRNGQYINKLTMNLVEQPKGRSSEKRLGSSYKYLFTYPCN